MAARGRQQPACGGQKRSVTRSQLRALDLTTQNVQLMAQQALTSTRRPLRSSNFSSDTKSR
jgi:hypothetical protein